ncbi:MAG: hypothetical protein MI922_15470 [Bacteroidales bacterium]|nr:hypothetical protein [Bacteroidales bacterium]
MNQTLQILAFISLPLILNSCGTLVLFDNPQPARTRALESVPECHQGKYVIKGDKDTILVFSDVFIIHKETEVKSFSLHDRAHKECIENPEQSLNSLDYDSITILSYETTMDSAIFFYKAMNIFELNENLVVKYFKNRYFVNLMVRGLDYWYLFIIQCHPTEGYHVQTLKNRHKDFLDELMNFTEIEMKEGGVVLIDPSRWELQRMLKNDVFESAELLKIE